MNLFSHARGASAIMSNVVAYAARSITHVRLLSRRGAWILVAHVQVGAQGRPRTEANHRRFSWLTKINIRTLLEAGCHFGHQTRRWNPR